MSSMPITHCKFARCCLFERGGHRVEELNYIAALWDPGLAPGQEFLRESIGRVLSREAFSRGQPPPVDYVHHHLAHAAPAFFASGSRGSRPRRRWCGRERVHQYGFGRGTVLNLEQKFGIAHSLGYFYGFTGRALRIGPRERRYLMGLAAYGERGPDLDPIKLDKRATMWTSGGFPTIYPRRSCSGRCATGGGPGSRSISGRLTRDLLVQHWDGQLSTRGRVIQGTS